MPLFNPLFSGSLTRQLDGSSYLVAGTNVTIVTQSNGQVLISSTGGPGGPTSSSNQPWVDGINKIKTSGSVSIDADNHFATDYGTDIFFFVSGSKGGPPDPNRHIAVFGGDVFFSGSMTGSHSVLSDGTSYIAGGTNISVVTQSNGQLVITSSITIQGGSVGKGTAQVINFTGAGVVATITNNTASVSITGGAGATWSQIEVDFGSLPRYVVTASIVDGTVSATSKINIWQAGIAPTGKTADENEMDGLICNAKPGIGTFILNAIAVPGPITGKYVFWYTVQ